MGDLWKGLSLGSLARLSQAGLAFALVLCLALALPLDALGRTLLGVSGAAIAHYALAHWFATALLREPDLNQGDVDRFLRILAAPAALAAGAGILAGQPAAAAAAVLFLAEAAFACQANLAAGRGRWGDFGRLYAVRAPAAFLLPLAAAFATKEAAPVLLASAAGVALSAVFGRRRDGAGDPARIRRAFADYTPLSVNAVIRQSFDRGDRLAVGALFGAEAAGVYGLAADIVRRPVQVLAGAAQTAMLPRLSASFGTPRFAPLFALNGGLVGWPAALAALAAVLGLDLLFVQLWPGKVPPDAVALAAILGLSAILEALDTCHLSLPLVAARSTRSMPAAYLAASGVFAAAAGLAFAADSLPALAGGVVAANLFACLAIGRMAGRTGRAGAGILLPLLVYGAGAAPLALWPQALPALAWGPLAGSLGAGLAAALMRGHVARAAAG